MTLGPCVAWVEVPNGTESGLLMEVVLWRWFESGVGAGPGFVMKGGIGSMAYVVFGVWFESLAELVIWNLASFLVEAVFAAREGS